MNKIVIAYVPVVHRGYLEFFGKTNLPVYLISSAFIREFDRMERDIRAVEPLILADSLQAALDATGGGVKVSVLTPGAELKRLKEINPKIVMPDESLSREFAETHLGGLEIEFVNVFLRWDKQISAAEHEVSPDRVITRDAAEREIMSRLREIAERSPDWWRQIGSAIFIDGEPVLWGYNRPLKNPDYVFGAMGDPRSDFIYGERIELQLNVHGEASLIAEAARRGIPLDGGIIKVGTYPCPNCAKLIALSGLKGVYYEKGYSLLDAEEIFNHFGIEIVMVQ
jgi:dCMP deaminase